MSIEVLLNDPVNSYMIFIPGASTDVVIGAPHHAPLGVPNLPCESHPSSDENSGWIAYHLAHRLDCPCVIAGNYFLDANKHKDSDYFRKIEAVKPKILIEIHGQGSGSARYDIEISSGSLEKSAWSQEMAERLSSAFASHPVLRSYFICGDFRKIFFKAQKSVSINTNEWLAFHIELPQRLREAESQYILFCEMLEKIVLASSW